MHVGSGQTHTRKYALSRRRPGIKILQHVIASHGCSRGNGQKEIAAVQWLGRRLLARFVTWVALSCEAITSIFDQ
jgi:hypothetical protein